MKRIEFKAYGGTGALVGRSFITLLALNAADLARPETKNDQCVIYQLDYDDKNAGAGQKNDGTQLNAVIHAYQKLYKRNLRFLAPIELSKHPMTLKKVRENAYGPRETEYSLNSIYLTGSNSSQIRRILRSSYTTGSPSDEIERSNRDGCYGDLAVNGFISQKIIEKNSFQSQHAYNDFANIEGSIAFYAGSTDGGTANTMIDKDIESMLRYLEGAGKSIGHDRKFKIYGLRTTPYSKFALEGNADDIAITRDILKDKFAMSKGVFENIQRQNENANDKDIRNYSYFYLNNTQKYWLDGLCIGSSNKLDLTCEAAHKDNQFHPSHLVEFTLAAHAMEAISKRLVENPDEPHIYAYNDGADDEHGDPVTLSGFFNGASVKYDFEYVDGDGGAIPLDKYIRAVLLVLTTVRGSMVTDFERSSTYRSAPNYIQDIFRSYRDDVGAVAPLIAEELRAFLAEAKFIVMCLLEIQQCSKFGRTAYTVRFMDNAVKYLYSEDEFGNRMTMSADEYLTIDDANGYYVKTAPIGEFSVLEDLRNGPYVETAQFRSGRLRSQKVYATLMKGTSEASAEAVANDLIRRLFELYLNLI